MGVSVQDKAQFYCSSHQLVGTSLKAAIQEKVAKERERKRTTKFARSGEWLDLADLHSRFSDKSEQIASIVQNARTYDCPLRGVPLVSFVCSALAWPARLS